MTVDIINNTLFEKKHHYMLAMREIEILKRQMEHEALNEEISKARLEETKSIWNYLFVGMLREGLGFQYIKNANNPAKDMVRITVDSVNYDCMASVLKNILKDEFYDILNITKTPSDEAANVPQANDNTKEQVTDNKGIKDNFSDIEEFVPTEEQKEDIEKIYPEPYDEAIKRKDSFVYDVHHIEILQAGAKKGDKFDVTVVPFTIEKDTNKANIMVVVKKGDSIQTFYSKETSSVVVSFDEQEFLVRGTFADYEFNSFILTHGISATMNCSINDDKEEHRCLEPAKVNYGHIKYNVMIEEENKGILHIVPLSDENNKYGYADSVSFVELPNGEITSTIGVRTKKGLPIILENEKIVQVLNYWNNDFFSSEVTPNVN